MLFCKMYTEEGGYPLVKFSPTSETLNIVSAFLSEDVFVLLPVIDDLLQDVKSCKMWNGNRFLLTPERENTTIRDKYGETTHTIETKLLERIICEWREFVAEIPLQDQFK